jgi:bacteriorhodopsin
MIIHLGHTFIYGLFDEVVNSIYGYLFVVYLKAVSAAQTTSRRD